MRQSRNSLRPGTRMIAKQELKRPWTEAEVAELYRMIEAGSDPRSIGQQLQRPILGVRMKITRLKHARGATDNKPVEMGLKTKK